VTRLKSHLHLHYDEIRGRTKVTDECWCFLSDCRLRHGMSRSRWSYLILHCVISLQPEVREYVWLTDTQARPESGPAGLQPLLTKIKKT